MIEFLADVGHRVRSICGKLFTVGELPLYKCALRPVEAKRMKIGITYAVYANILLTFAEFASAFLNASISNFPSVTIPEISILCFTRYDLFSIMVIL